jgi:hypothetical protein
MPDLSYLGATTDIYNRHTSLIEYNGLIEHRKTSIEILVVLCDCALSVYRINIYFIILIY